LIHSAIGGLCHIDGVSLDGLSRHGTASQGF
jgi:hypothetical protein